MAHRTELNTKIALLTGLSKHTIDRIGVNLNKGGLLLAGGRGRHAPDMGPEDLKNIILAVLGSESTGVVFKTVLQLHALTAKDGQNFGDTLLDICTDPKMAAEVLQISVLRNYPSATIYWKDESDTRKGKRQNFRDLTEREQPGMRVVASLSGNVVRKLVQLVTGPEVLEEISEELINKAGQMNES
jgi:hypothetical protein